MQERAGDAVDESGGTRKRRRGVSLATRLAGAAFGVSFAALAAATAVGVEAGLSLGTEIYEDRLVSLGNAGADDIAAAISSTSAAVDVLGLSPATATALDSFSAAFDDVVPTEEFITAVERRALIDAYDTLYRDELDAAGVDVTLETLITRAGPAVYLQSQYSLVDDPDDRPASVDDANDGSEWSEVHATYHASFRRFVDELGLIDLYLIDAEDERIVYSVEKGIDLGTSLAAGPFSGSVLANTVNRIIEDPSVGSAASDLSFYDGKPGEIVGVLASPVFDGDRFVGVAAGLYDGNVPTVLITNDGDWEAAGFDESTDRYVVGDDGTMRSDPRAYLEDPTAFLDAAELSATITADQREQIERYGTTVLTLPAIDATLAEPPGEANEGAALDGTDVVSAVADVESNRPGIDAGFEWTVVTEIDLAEAETSLDDFRNILVVGTAVFLIIVAFLAVAWANRMMAPVRLVSDRLADPDTSGERVEIAASSPLEFHYLVASFGRMAGVLRRQHRRLAVARQERLQLMQQMLPPAVAERAASGDLDDLDEVPSTSVAVIVVLGLAALVGERGSDGRRIVESLHEELDGLAEQHGLDRIKVVGDAYFASCGHDRPYLDHAPRAVTFAADARDAIEAFGRESGAHLGAAIGVHTGSVTIGMVGQERMIFDVWGDTVSYAHLLARRATDNEILLSDRTHDYMPDEVVTEATTVGDEPVWSVPLSTVGQL